MKIRLIITLSFIFLSLFLWAQTVPQGINYQAVARDAKGKPIVNQEINLKITLLSGNAGGPSVYEETHAVASGELGMFSLVIGKGKTVKGEFTRVPWSASEIWIEIALDESNTGQYTPISASQLMAVPYALHAGTAGDVILNTESERSLSGPSPYWKVNGNVMTFPPSMFLGTIDCKDLIFKTNNIKRLSITCTGVVDIGGNLFVGGTFNAAGIVSFTNPTQSTNINNGAVIIGGGLGVAKNVNIGGTLCADGVTTLKNTTESTNKDNGSLVVEGGVGIEKNINIGGNSNITGNSGVSGNSDVIGNLGVSGIGTFRNKAQSTTIDNGSLVVDGGAGIELNLNVGGNTEVDGTLGVDGITTLKNTTESTSFNNGALIVDGGAGIEKNLNVGGNTEVDGTLGVDGVTTLKNTTESSTKDNGALVVEGGVGIEKNLNVGGNSGVIGNSTVGGTLGVNGIATFNNTAQSTAISNGALIVKGGAGVALNLNVGGNTEVDGTLGVDGVSTLRNNLMVMKNDANFVATFTNTNNTTGDGLLIKLGKAKSIYSPPAIPSLISSAELAQIKDLIRCDFPGNRIDLLGNIVISGLFEDGIAIGGLAVGVGNLIVDFINTQLGLPIKLGPLVTPSVDMPAITIPFITVVPEVDLEIVEFGPYGFGPTSITAGFNIVPPTTLLPQFTAMPALPNIDLSGIGIPSIPIYDLSFWGIPTNLCLSDAPGSAPLNNSNEFIRFTDKDNAKMGSIRAVSVTDWATNYLNPIFLFKLRGAILSSKVDKFHAQYHFKSEISEALNNYASLGVEYTSGNGDYAEWLERIDTKELISAGDIVGVIGGKITKDLEKAEQVMAVSHNPIVLGNVPVEGKINQGNNIAFMGQVPVKIVGPVSSGDYIVGQSSTPGYGVAKHPNEMLLEDFKNAVGRSWVNDLSEDPKMVNTVIGVHNGDYIQILKKFENRFKESESRLETLEAKVDAFFKTKDIATGNN